jgi:hypothetical protein
MDMMKPRNGKKENKAKVKRKDNPDYERKVVRTRDGVNQTIYRKKNKEQKRQVGTPQKRRGAFKTKKTLLDVPPSNASSMAKPISNIEAQKAAKNAVFQQDYLERLSVKTREQLQGEYKAPKQVAQMKSKSRANV